MLQKFKPVQFRLVYWKKGTIWNITPPSSVNMAGCFIIKMDIKPWNRLFCCWLINKIVVLHSIFPLPLKYSDRRDENSNMYCYLIVFRFCHQWLLTNLWMLWISFVVICKKAMQVLLLSLPTWHIKMDLEHILHFCVRHKETAADAHILTNNNTPLQLRVEVAWNFLLQCIEVDLKCVPTSTPSG